MSACLAAAASQARADVVYFTTETGVSQITQGGTPSVFVAANAGNHLESADGIAIDTNGNIYVDSIDQGEIVKIAPNTSTSIFYNPNTLSGVYRPLVVDQNGNVYASELSGGVEKITPSGVVTSIGSATGVPGALARAPDGTLYYESEQTAAITKIATDGTTTPFSSGFGDPYSGNLAVDSSGNVYIAGTSLIYEITPSGSVSTFISGVTTPYGLAFGPNGDLYVSNSDPAESLFAVTPAGVVSTFATSVAMDYMVIRATPEPASTLLVAFAATALLGRRRGRKAISALSTQA
jgi:sugar lactone lactonase YvrE